MNGDNSTPSEQPDAPWKFTANAGDDQGQSQAHDAEVLSDDASANVMQLPQDDSVEWTASEYVAHHKSPLWYVGVVVATVVLAVIVRWLTHDITSMIIVVFLAIVFVIAARKKPRILPYRLDGRGVSIGAQVFPYSAFRSFFIVDEDAFSNITLTSTNRFMPNVSIYYAPEDEPAIVGFLSQHLPIEQGRIDRVERMMHRLRF